MTAQSSRVDWSLHTKDGRTAMLGGDFGLDRGWSPQGQGSYVLPLAEYEALRASGALRSRQREPVLLVGEVWFAYSDALDGLELTGAGTTLGGATWPIPTHDEHFLQYLQSSSVINDARGRAVAWQVYPRDVVIDDVQQTATVELATVEVLLQDARNVSGADIAPPQSAAGVYLVGRMLTVLAAQVGVRLLLPGSDFTVPSVEPWRVGQTLWDWFTRVRTSAGLGYTLNPESNTLSLVPVATWPYGTVTGPAFERSIRVGAITAAGLEFADALTLTWRWVVNDVEQVRTETVFAAGVASWRDATRAIDLDRAGPPITGVAQRIVDNLSRLRRVATITTATTSWTLSSAPLSDFNFQSVRYGFTDELATVTILEES